MANSRIRGITIEIDGNTTKLQQALQQVNTSLGNTKSALGDVNRLLRFDPGSTELLRQKQTYLSQAIDETEEKLKQEKEALRQLEEAGKTTENQEQQRALKREIESTEQSLKSLKSQAAEAASVLGSRMQTAGQKMQSVGSKISGVGRNLSMYVTAPLVGVGAAVTKVTADFDEQMSKVQAISGAMGDDFDALRDKARELGMSSKYSAAEVGAGFEYMAMAGWKTEDMLQGIDGVLNLAAASGEELGTTSDIVTDALTAFGLSAKDSSHFADVLAAASTNANTNVSMLGESFKYAAPVAGALGISAEDTSVALGLMANAGIKASQAGTSLRTGLTNLSKPTKQMQEYMDKYNIALVQNEDGSVNLRQTMISLREKMGDLTTTEQAAAAAAIFGKDSMSGWLAIVNASEADFEKLTSSIDNCDGAAKSMAEIMQDNLNGELTKLKSALQEAGISLGESLVPMLRKAVTWIQGAVDKFNSLDESTKENIVKFGLFAAAVGPVMTAIGTMTSGVGGLVTGLGKVVSKVTAFSSGLGGVPFGPASIAFAGVAAAIGLVVTANKLQEDAYRDANEEIYAAIDASEKARQAMEQTGDAIGTAFDEANESIEMATERADMAHTMVDRLEELVSAEQLSSAEMIEAKSIVSQLNAAYPGLNAEIDENGKLLGTSTDEMRGFIDNALEMATVEAKQQALKNTMQELTDAITAKVEAQAREKQVTEELQKAEESYTAEVKKLNDARESGEISATEYGYKIIQLNNERSKSINDLQTEQAALTEQTDELNEQIQAGTDKYNAEKEIIEETTGALTDNADAAGETATATEAVGDAAQDTAGDVEEMAKTAQQAYDEMYEDAMKSVQGQVGLFDTLSTEYDQTMDSMIAAQESQITAMNDYYNNLSTVWKWAVETGDMSARQYVQSLADMGIDGAGYVQQLAQSINEGTDGAARSVELFRQRTALETGQYASLMQQIKSDTYVTKDGVVWAYDAMASGAQTGMSNINAWVGNGMGQMQNTINTGMNNAVSGMYSSGMNGATNFANGMYGGGYNVSSAAWYLANTANDPLGNVTNNAYGWGAGLSQNFANGMWAKAQEVWNAAQSLANNVWSMMHHTTPEEGPLKDDDKWGAELAENFAAGMTAKAGLVQKAAGVLANAAVVQNLNSRNGFDISGAAGAGATVAGDDITFNIYASEGMNINQIADAVEQRLALVRRQKASAYA